MSPTACRPGMILNVEQSGGGTEVDIIIATHGLCRQAILVAVSLICCIHNPI